MILQSTDGIAASHQLFAQRIEKDVELPLRLFQERKEMKNMQDMSVNLQAMAKDLEDATEKAEKLNRKGGKANPQKVEQAAAKLESATQQWESAAPFMFETLQALDEQRINHLRDVLTQFETHAVDQATRCQKAAEEVLNVMLEVNTTQEIQNFTQKVTSGKPRIERKSTSSRQPTPVSTSAPAHPIVTPDDASEHSAHRDGHQGMKMSPSAAGSKIGSDIRTPQKHRNCAVASAPCWDAGGRASIPVLGSLAHHIRTLAPTLATSEAVIVRRCLRGPPLTT